MSQKFFRVSPSLIRLHLSAGDFVFAFRPLEPVPLDPRPLAARPAIAAMRDKWHRTIREARRARRERISAGAEP